MNFAEFALLPGSIRPTSAAVMGSAPCGAFRYRLTSHPLFTHCRHCLNCQRQSGPDSVPAFEVYYDSKALWPAASLERLDAILAPANSDA